MLVSEACNPLLCLPLLVRMLGVDREWTGESDLFCFLSIACLRCGRSQVHVDVIILVGLWQWIRAEGHKAGKGSSEAKEISSQEAFARRGFQFTQSRAWHRHRDGCGSYLEAAGDPNAFYETASSTVAFASENVWGQNRQKMYLSFLFLTKDASNGSTECTGHDDTVGWGQKWLKVHTGQNGPFLV